MAIYFHTLLIYLSNLSPSAPLLQSQSNMNGLQIKEQVKNKLITPKAALNILTARDGGRQSKAFVWLEKQAAKEESAKQRNAR